MKNAFLIVNPVSGKLKAKESLYQIIDRLTAAEILPTVMYTRHRGHASELAAGAAASGRYDALIVVGGDGTLNEVNTGLELAGLSIPVGYIPSGTTNDFASGLGLALELPAAASDIADAMNSGKSLSLDIGRFGDERFFSYIASFGAFVNSSYSTPQAAKNALGHFAYVLQGIGDFFQIKPIHTVCEANGVKYEGDFIFGGVCNTFSVGGIVKLDESIVNLSDGMFEVVLVKNPKDLVEFNTLLGDLLVSNLDSDMLIFFKANEVSFSIPESTDWTLDGEKAADVSNVKIKIVPGALDLLTARRSNKNAASEESSEEASEEPSEGSAE